MMEAGHVMNKFHEMKSYFTSLPTFDYFQSKINITYSKKMFLIKKSVFSISHFTL